MHDGSLELTPVFIDRSVDGPPRAGLHYWEKIRAPNGIRTSHRPAHGLVAITIMLSWFLPQLCISFKFQTSPVIFINTDIISYGADSAYARNIIS